MCKASWAGSGLTVFQEGQFQQHAGATEPGDTPSHQGGWIHPEPGLMPAAGDGVPDGILGGLVGYKGLPERGFAQFTRQQGGVT